MSKVTEIADKLRAAIQEFPVDTAGGKAHAAKLAGFMHELYDFSNGVENLLAVCNFAEQEQGRIAPNGNLASIPTAVVREQLGFPPFPSLPDRVENEKAAETALQKEERKHAETFASKKFWEAQAALREVKAARYRRACRVASRRFRVERQRADVFERLAAGIDDELQRCSDNYHRTIKEREELRRRSRSATQKIIEAIGAAGPENADQAADRIISRLQEAERERDETMNRALNAEFERADLRRQVAELQEELATKEGGLLAAEHQRQSLSSALNGAIWRIAELERTTREHAEALLRLHERYK